MPQTPGPSEKLDASIKDLTRQLVAAVDQLAAQTEVMKKEVPQSVAPGKHHPPQEEQEKR